MPIALSCAVLFGIAHSPHALSDRTFAALVSTVTGIGQEDISVAERNRKLEVVFETPVARLDQRGLARLPDDEVEAYFEASSIVAEYLLKPEYAGHARRAFDELVRRGEDVQAQRRRMLDIHLVTRMVDQAVAFAATLPSREKAGFPRFAEARLSGRDPTVWHVSSDASLVTRRDFSLGEGIKVVVTGSPWCPFARAAAADIEQDAELLDMMRRHATWLVPQHTMPNIGDVSKWNQQHPGLPMDVVYAAHEWPDIANWATPVFYFFEDGELRGTVTGWPDRGQHDVLRKEFEQLGAR